MKTLGVKIWWNEKLTLTLLSLERTDVALGQRHGEEPVVRHVQVAARLLHLLHYQHSHFQQPVFRIQTKVIITKIWKIKSWKKCWSKNVTNFLWNPKADVTASKNLSAFQRARQSNSSFFSSFFETILAGLGPHPIRSNANTILSYVTTQPNRLQNFLSQSKNDNTHSKAPSQCFIMFSNFWVTLFLMVLLVSRKQAHETYKFFTCKKPTRFFF